VKLKDTVGAVTYPVPAAVTVTEDRALLVIVAVAVAPEPPPYLIAYQLIFRKGFLLLVFLLGRPEQLQSFTKKMATFILDF
jgi:hypothetical protein